ncbi:MAG: arsenite methyltransferase, partial [Candidatus Eisenbacteria bacterium]|nr:arsenite methyltransferase [Candidatus Eisenbacteria bacterium]
LPPGANLGLSCGNPTALASLRAGEVVVDLGSGAGLDVLIAAGKVGPQGRVIGVDMTPQMLANARRNAAAVRAENVEFRLGEIESLPVADASVDVVISNCVINLSPDKPRVFREIARVLRPGGRVAVSDLALLRPLPEAVREDMEAYVGCIAGAVLLEEYVAHMRAAGLTEIEVEPVGTSAGLDSVQDPLYERILAKLPAGTRPEQYVASVRVQGRKPVA